jgi:hypothetical protein
MICCVVQSQNLQRLVQCCDYYDDDVRLFECIQEFNNNNYDMEYTTSVPSFAIITRATDSIIGDSYAAYSSFLQSMYAHLHGYQLQINRRAHISSQDDYVLFPKLSLILGAMRSHTTVDYVVWMDSDLIPLNLSRSFQEITALHPAAHIIMSADVSSRANTGCIIAKNSAWIRSFIDAWLNVRRSHDNGKGGDFMMTEQQGLDMLYANIHKKNQHGPTIRLESEEWDENVVILAPNVLNSEAPPMFKQLPTDPVSGARSVQFVSLTK